MATSVVGWTTERAAALRSGARATVIVFACSDSPRAASKGQSGAAELAANTITAAAGREHYRGGAGANAQTHRGQTFQ